MRTIFIRRSGCSTKRRRDQSRAIGIDGDVRSFDLHPREELTMAVPILDPRPGALIRIDSASGFTPSEVEPGSTDERFLGVWVEFR